MSDETWRDRAACRGMDTDLFFAERGESDDQAKAVCLSCHVRIECLASGLEEKHGVWGGLSERGRRRVRRELPSICADCGVSFRRIGSAVRCEACRVVHDRAQRAAHMRRARRGAA
jgi:hypothetical protein